MTFDIQEGPRVYVERINISGNTRTLDKVIRREFRLAEGDAFSTAKVRRSQQRLKNLGFFEKVDISARPARRRTRPTSRSRWSSRALAKSRSAPATRRRRASWATSRSASATCSARARSSGSACRSAPLSTLIDLASPSPISWTARWRRASTSSGPRTTARQVASYSDSSIGFALRTGWAYTEHSRQNVRYTLRQTDIYNVQPWASTDRAAQRRHVGGVGNRPRPSPGIPATPASTRPRASCCATRWRWRGLIGTEQYYRTTADAVYYQSIFEDVVASIGGSIGGVFPYNGSSLRLNNLLLHRRRHVARLPGRRHRAAQFDHRGRAGRHLLLQRHDRTQLPARPAQGDRHLRQGVRGCRLAVGAGRAGPVQQHGARPATPCACRPASASNGYRRSGRSV